MKNIAVVGDTHGEILSMYEYLINLEDRLGMKFDAVLHVGDLGVGSRQFNLFWTRHLPAPITTYVNPGNHESYRLLDAWMQDPQRVINMTLLPDGGITDVLGIKVGSVWGNYSPKSYENKGRILMARMSLLNHGGQRMGANAAALHVRKSAVDKLADAGKFDVLITHEAPFGMQPLPKQGDCPEKIKKILGLDPDEEASGCPGFNYLHRSGEPRFHFFGHYHKHRVVQLSGPRVVALNAFNYDPATSIEIVQYDENIGDLFTINQRPIPTEG